VNYFTMNTVAVLTSMCEIWRDRLHTQP
jgi:hypothetical protein